MRPKLSWKWKRSKMLASNTAHTHGYAVMVLSANSNNIEAILGNGFSGRPLKLVSFARKPNPSYQVELVILEG